MESYIKKLTKLIQFEREAEVTLMRKEIKRTSARKREQLGRAINNLKGKVIGHELGFTIIKYGRRDLIDTEISVSDEVLLSRGNPLKSDLTATVTEKGNRYIKVAMDFVPRWALSKAIRMDLYINDITYKRMEDNLFHLSENGKRALKYLLEENDLKNQPYEENIEFIDENLNQSQKDAIKESLASKDFFLIHGPFGTGKTRTIIELIKQEHIKGSKILATTESNSAVDNILERLIADNYKINCTRLGHPQRISDENIKYSMAYKVENHELNFEISTIQDKLEGLLEEREEHTKPTPQYRRGFSDNQIIDNAQRKKGGRGISAEKMISMGNWLELNKIIQSLQDEIKKIRKEIERDIIKNSDLILSTNSSSALEVLASFEFDTSIIDEASQATIPSVLIPIAKSKKFILTGDHKQLPPTILSKNAQYLSNTLFEKLIEKYPQKSKLLNIQYRMNDTLMAFPNNEFYNGQLKSVNTDDFEDSLAFIDTSDYENNQEQRLKDSKSIINKLEASLVVKISKDFIENGFNIEDIGIITPYADQVNLIKDKTPIEIKTVDGFQGREKDIIIISTVRSNDKGNLGFLTDLRRLNVSITRARRMLVIIGNSKTLKTNPTYEKLISQCTSYKG